MIYFLSDLQFPDKQDNNDTRNRFEYFYFFIK
jgi:hypothetical protein